MSDCCDVAGHARAGIVPSSTPSDEQTEVRTFQAGAQLTTRSLLLDDVLLSGWVGLGGPDCDDGGLIGILLPGDRIGTVLDNRLCSAIALTAIGVTSNDAPKEGMPEVQHLVRQCIRTCHFSALDRIEDFFRETYRRLEAVELASNGTFECPLPQATLGNLLGLSTAHVNRTIKQLQAQARIQIEGRVITLLRDAEIGPWALNARVA